MGAKKGNTPWNKGKQGLQIAWNKGKVFEKNTVLKRCLQCKNEFKILPHEYSKRIYCSRICSDKSKIGKPSPNIGKKYPPLSKEARIKISMAHKGKKLSKEHCKKLSERQIGSKNHAWKGGIIRNSGNYILLYSPNHPYHVGKYVFEHRLVMEKILGRYLEPFEIIHHRNGIKTDNRPENLELAIRKVHFGSVRCPHCLKEFLIK